MAYLLYRRYANRRAPFYLSLPCIFLAVGHRRIGIERIQRYVLLVVVKHAVHPPERINILLDQRIQRLFVKSLCNIDGRQCQRDLGTPSLRRLRRNIMQRTAITSVSRIKISRRNVAVGI